MKKLLKLLEISAIVLFCAMSCTMSANAQGIGGKAGTGGKGGFGGGQASSSFTPGTTSVHGGCTTGGANCPSAGLSVIAGQFAVACMQLYGSVASWSVTDTNGDIFIPWPGGVVTSTRSVECWYAIVGTTNASEVYTFNNTVAEPYMAGTVALYTGTPTSGWDVTPAGLYTSSTACSYTSSSGTSGTTTAASELGIAVFGGNAVSVTFSTIGSWTIRTHNSGTGIAIGIADNILSSTQTLTATTTIGCVGSTDSIGAVASIK